MDFASENGAAKSNERWWKDDNTRSQLRIPSSSSTTSAIEHAALAEVAANMRSGFLLLNQGERIMYSNSSAGRLLGVSSQALLDQPILDVREQLLARAADPERARLELDRLWLHPEQDDSTDLALVDAAIQWLRVQCFPIRDALGDFLGRGMLLDDITLERSSAQSSSETLGLAAHELKTPLAIIKGCATTLLGSSTRWDPNMQREMLQMIDTQADRLHEVLNTLLDVWRFDAGAQTLYLAQVNLAELLQHFIERWQEHAPRHRFILTLPPTLPSVLCDPVRLEQALNHLLNNAVTYSSAGGNIRLQVETNEVETRLSISDEGIGIAPEYFERIFDRFYRIPQRGKEIPGSGLGLAVARATVEAHGGKIWADSSGNGQGATFYFTLPLAPRLPTGAPSQEYHGASVHPLPALPKEVVTGSLRQNRRSRILVAENDARLARYLRSNLEEQHYQVQTVKQGVQFLRQLDLEEPDVILLADLGDMQSLELLQRVREFSQARVIVLCTACDEDEHVRFLDLGADDVVPKPFSIKELLARVRTQLRRQVAPTEPATGQATLKIGDLVIDHAQHQVFLKDEPVQLSRTEYKLLATLAQHAGMVMTHELLLERVWGPEYNREIDFIWVYISRLRRKIEPDPRHPRYILTVPDVGYKLAKQ